LRIGAHPILRAARSNLDTPLFIPRPIALGAFTLPHSRPIASDFRGDESPNI
jgi:hypothetical protein